MSQNGYKLDTSREPGQIDCSRDNSIRQDCNQKNNNVDEPEIQRHKETTESNAGEIICFCYTWEQNFRVQEQH